MTVPVSDRLSQLYVGNGANTRFDFTFRVFNQESESGVVVRQRTSEGFITIDPALYSVTLNQENLGGFIEFQSPPNSSTYFYIAGATPLDQLLDITNYDNFYPEAIERALDKLTVLLQEWGVKLDLEKQERILADIKYDSLAMEREANLENRLISYINAVVGITNPKIFDGITDRMVITKDGRTQREFNESIPFWTDDYVSFKQETYLREEKILDHVGFEDAKLDLKINNEMLRASNAEQLLQNQINANGVGNRAYKIYADMDADKANIPPKSKVTVTNDPNPAVNGDYNWDGFTFTKSAYDPVTQAKEFSKNTVTSVAAKVENTGYYTGASSSNVITTTSTASGFEVSKNGKIVSFRTQTAGAPAGVALQIYRAKDYKKLELISTQDIALVQAASYIELINPVQVKKGDIVVLKYLSGAFVRGLVVATGEPLGSYTITTAGTNIGDLAELNRSRNKPEFEFNVVSSEVDKTSPGSDLISPLAANFGPLKNEIVTTNGEFFTDTTTTGSLTYAYGTSKSVDVFSKLKQIKYKARVTGVNAKFTIAIIENVNGSFFVQDLIPVSAPADSNGIVIATKDHFGEVFVPKDAHVMVLGATTSDAVLAKTGSTLGWYYVAAASLVEGANVSVLFSTSNPISLEISFSSVVENLSERVEKLENNTLMAAPLLYTKRLVKEPFLGTTLPVNWTESGGWVVANGLKSPASGGWSTVAKHAEYSAMAKRVYRAKFLVANASSVFGICTTPIEAGSGSAVAMIDGVQNKLIIYLWDGANAGTPVASVAIPALVANRSYYLEVEKNGYFSTVTLIDTISQIETKVEYSATAPYVQFHGQGGVMFISGDITVQYFSFNALYPNEPHAIIVGDSNSERAANVLPNQTWAFKYAEMRHLNADVIVAGRSGDETPNFLKRKQFDLLVWKPKYVIWALGTNDTSQATWRTNMTQNIADTVALGAEPILVTQIPRTDSQALRTAMNDDIRNGYFGNYRYVDFAKAVSLNNDGVTWDPLYNSGDNVHVNPAGQQKLLQQLLSDAPDVLY